MNDYLLLIFSLLCRVIYGSLFDKYRIIHNEGLKIDQPKFKFGADRPQSIIYLNSKVNSYNVIKFLDREFLRDLYEMAETGKIDESVDFDYICFEIFDSNEIFAYTPAEWAVYNGQTEVLRTFMEKTRIVAYSKTCLYSIFKNILALSIQRNNFEALKCIIICTEMQVKGQGFLSIAAQHHSNDQILKFLLNDCDLKSEIDQSDSFNTYLTPLNACIKFNFFDGAILFLKYGASLILTDSLIDSPLVTIFTLNKFRMLKSILANFPEFCDLIDTDGNSLYHYAAISSKNTEMISIIHKSCPNLSVNIKNLNGLIPLNNCFNTFIRKEMALSLVSIGADIFHVPEEGHLSPLQIIFDSSYKGCFYSIIKIYHDKMPLISQIVQHICGINAWEWLDRVLEVYPDIPSVWFDFSQATFPALLKSNAWRTFRVFLRNYMKSIPQGFIFAIIENGSREFLKIAIENGADVEEIYKNDDRMISTEENEKIFDLIKNTSTESF